MTAGPVPNNPAELLGTPQIYEMLHQLTVNHGYDVVIFDTPPVLLVSDTSVLANVSKAGIIMVVEAGHTRRGAAVRAVQQLATLSVQPLGIVMNRMHPRDADAGYGQYYYYGYYGYSQQPNQVTNPGQNGQSANSGVAIQK
jgi:Mrp family chromosome partitioning ATPase